MTASITRYTNRPGWQLVRRPTLRAVSLILGLTLNSSILFGQDGDKALVIAPSGNVGIGTTRPGAALDVSGKANTDKQVSLQLRSGNTSSNFNSNQITFGYNNTETYRHAIKTRHHSGQQANNALDFYVWKHGDDAAAIGGLHVMTLDGGNVGIGTTDPGSYKIKVDGSSRLGGATNYASNTVLSVAPGEIQFDAPNVPGGRLTINGSTGNVGIGTTRPGAALDVSGKADTDKQVSLQLRSGNTTSNFNSNQITFGYNNTETYRHAIKTRHNASQQAGNALDFYVWKHGDDAAAIGGLHVMTLDGGNIGIGTTDPGQSRLKVVGNTNLNGNVIVEGSLYAKGKLAYYWGPDGKWKKIENRANNFAGSYTDGGPSDLRLKTELRLVPSALQKVHHLRGVTYHWNDQALQYFTKDIETTLSAGPEATEEENRKLWQAEREKQYKELAKTHIGVIAQDVEAVLPEAVTTDEQGYKSVRYHYLIALLIEALKEQDKTVQEQAELVTQQQAKIERLTVAQQMVQQQLAELAALKGQLAQLEATVRHIAATQASGASPYAMVPPRSGRSEPDGNRAAPGSGNIPRSLPYAHSSIAYP